MRALYIRTTRDKPISYMFISQVLLRLRFSSFVVYKHRIFQLFILASLLLRCGLRGGYVEVVGLHNDVMKELKKLQSAQLCANTVGQIVVDCVTNPPKPGDESYNLFMQVCTSHSGTFRKQRISPFGTINLLHTGLSGRQAS